MGFKGIILGGGKKPYSKGYILFDSIYIKLLKWQNHRDREQVIGCQGLEMVEGEVVVTVKGQHKEDFCREGQFCILTTVMATQIWYAAMSISGFTINVVT